MRTRPVTTGVRTGPLVALVVAAALLGAACSDDGADPPPDDPSTPSEGSGEEGAGIGEEAGTAGLPAGELPPCSEMDPDPPYTVPARFLPTEVPDGWVLTAAATLVPLTTGEAPLQRSALVEDGAVVAEIELERSGSFPDGARVETVRGDDEARVGEIGTAVSVTWVEDSEAYKVEAAGLAEGELLALLERAELGDDGLSLSDGSLLVLGHRPRPSTGTTELTYTVEGAAAPVEVLVEEYGEGGSGLEVIGSEPFLGPKQGLEVAEIGGRPALRGTDREGRERAMAAVEPQVGDAAAVLVDGAVDAATQDAIITGIEAVGPDDPRLESVPVSYDIFSFDACLPDDG